MRHIIVFEVVLLGFSIFGLGESSSVGEDLVRVDFKQGAIETSRTDLENGQSFYAFKNIPFAEPPVGSLRFKNPVAAGPWTGVRDGSVDPSACPQMDMMSIFAGEVKTVGNEDCLYLNIYTSKPHSSGLPVMVWIHGGGFIMGSAAEYIPDHLMTKDVVVVLIQYRLGTLGFLSTEDDVMSGNYGLKDQVMALRWVQENIEAFGGDPKRVTIFGESAGGMSVHYLMVSPMSKGLFQRAIAESGTAMIPNALRDDHRATAVALGQMLQCSGVDPSVFDSQALYNCFQNIPEATLVLMGNAFSKFMMSPQVMAPSVDGEFFPEHPIKMIQEGKYHKVDFMTGINRDEGAFIVRPLLPNVDVVNSLAQNFSTNGPLQLFLDPDIDSEVYAAKRMFYHYIGDTKLSVEKADAAEKMFGDLMFNIPLDLTAQLHARDASYGMKTFIYEFHQVGEFSFMDSPKITFGKQWVGHGDEIGYLFSSPYFGTFKEPKSLFMSEMMVNMWTNFAATGNPTPDMSLGFKWDPLSGSDLRYLIIELSPYMRGFTREKKLEFMLNLPTRHNKRFFPERFAKEV